MFDLFTHFTTFSGFSLFYFALYRHARMQRSCLGVINFYGICFGYCYVVCWGFLYLMDFLLFKFLQDLRLICIVFCFFSNFFFMVFWMTRHESVSGQTLYIEALKEIEGLFLLLYSLESSILIFPFDKILLIFSCHTFSNSFIPSTDDTEKIPQETRINDVARLYPWVKLLWRFSILKNTRLRDKVLFLRVAFVFAKN